MVACLVNLPMGRCSRPARDPPSRSRPPRLPHAGHSPPSSQHFPSQGKPGARGSLGLKIPRRLHLVPANLLTGWASLFPSSAGTAGARVGIARSGENRESQRVGPGRVRGPLDAISSRTSHFFYRNGRIVCHFSKKRLNSTFVNSRVRRRKPAPRAIIRQLRHLIRAPRQTERHSEDLMVG